MTHMMLCDVHLESLYQLRYKVVGLCRRGLKLQASSICETKKQEGSSANKLISQFAYLRSSINQPEGKEGRNFTDDSSANFRSLERAGDNISSKLALQLGPILLHPQTRKPLSLSTESLNDSGILFYLY